MKKYFIKTFGCQMNFSDSERMASFLESNNFTPADDIAGADLVVFNTCGVRQTAEDRVYGTIHNLRKANPKCFIVVTGCLAHRKDVQRKLKEKADLFISINGFFKFKNLSIKNCLKIKNLKLKISAQKNKPSDENSAYFDIVPRYENNLKASVPIMTGCNNFCSYCVVPYARGREKSRPIESIFKEIDSLSKNNYQEITLLGQNVNSYEYIIKNHEERSMKKFSNSKFPFVNRKSKIENREEAVTFPLLLNYLAQTFPKIKFNFLTSHPKDFSDELIKVIKNNQNISREIHLPIQSGSDKILKKMNRPYTQKHYLNLIEKIKKEIPEVRISTDVIVGFPGETEKDFEETKKVFQKVGFFLAYVNKYSPRPGTAAFKLKDNISWEEKKRREKDLRKLVK